MKKQELINNIVEEVKSHLGGGDCYVAAGHFILDHSDDNDYVLVHGMVNGQGQLKGIKFGHAWIEFKNAIVIDNSNGRKIQMSKDAYYNAGKIDPKECKYYKPVQAMGFIVRYKHWGPWEMSGDPIKLTEDIPMTYKDVGKRNVKVDRDIIAFIQNEEEIK